jgi:hypothetical protein
MMKGKSAGKNIREKSVKNDPNRYPRGLNRRKVQAIIAHYENQTDDEAIAEDDAAYHSNKITMMGVPVRLVGKVQKLIAKRSG